MTFIVLFFMFISFMFYHTIFKNHRTTVSYVLYFLIIFSFLGLFICTCIYLAKDSIYSNIIIDFFFIPNYVLKKLMDIPVSRLIVSQLINLCSLTFITSCILFAIAYSSKKNYDKFKYPIIATSVLQLFIFDPLVYRLFYIIVYPDYLTFIQVKQLIFIITKIFLFINSTFLILSFILLLVYYFKLPAYREIKNIALFILLFHMSLIITYFFVFYWSPCYLIKVNKMAETISYLSIPLDYDYFTYTLLIIFQILFFIIIAVCLFKQNRFEALLRENKKSLLRNIDVAVVTSRLFTHYIKNEILAIQAEIDCNIMGSSSIDDYKTSLNAIKERCSDITQHLDSIHESLKFSKLVLKPQNLYNLLDEVITKLRHKLADITLEISDPKKDTYILADSYYMQEVLSNIIINSIDAMLYVPPENKKLEIKIQKFKSWVTIQLTDTGDGIDTKHIKEAFKPYYSTKSSRKNWGLGLFLCQRIISAHDGSIDIESDPGIFTTVKIILPCLYDSKEGI